MKNQNLIPALEAILFSIGEPVSKKRISEILDIDEEQIDSIIDKIIEKFSDNNSGIKIIKLKDKYQMCSKSEYSQYIRQLLNINNNSSLSSSAMEVLAVIAYNQPVTKSFIENIRGISCARIINNLIDKGLIKEKGRLDIPGKPIIYETTDNFLRCFGISSIEELPKPETLPENNENRGIS